MVRDRFLQMWAGRLFSLWLLVPWLVAASVPLLAGMMTPAMAGIAVHVTYLERQAVRPPTLSNLDPVPEDLGRAGAAVGIVDNATTGRFLGHTYTLGISVVAPDGDWPAAARAALMQGDILIVNAPAAALLTVADLPEAAGALIFNAGAEDDRLRDADCRARVLHSIPSHAMRADALAQFASRKRWRTWALITGAQPADTAFAAALRRSARKFRLTISDSLDWRFNADIRRNAGQEVPVFTQKLKSHDLLVIADEIGDFGRYFLYNSWEPTLVAGSEGLTPVAWSPVVEQWGGAQLQRRFREAAGRAMRSRDYAAWAAARSIGEAVTRGSAGDAASVRRYILSDGFALAGQKGRAMSYRRWNGQLRQPIPLVHPRAVVATAPLEGFLHQRSDLDTLGLDAPESACTRFADGR